MRKYFSLLFVLLVMLFVISFGATEAKAATYGDLTYEVIAGEAVITGYSTKPKGELVIPSNISGYPVTSIDNYAFEMCSGLTAVIIPDSLKSIGSHAFYMCSSLKSVTIPDSVRSIGIGAFQECTLLSTIAFSDNLTSVGRSALDNTAWYNTQPNGLVYVGKFAYKYKGTCPANIIVKDGTIGIVGGAFSRCTSLKTITIPEGVESIGDSAFWGCTSLSTIILGDSVTNIGYDAFYNTAWYNAQPNGLVYIGKVAYKYKGACPENIIIRDDTLGIGSYAFWACTNLTTIVIPDSVQYIGDEAFFACSNLVSVTLPSGLTSIGSYVFSGCEGLTSITIPENVLSIGENSFSNCTGLTSIIIPNNVQRINNYAFAECTSLSVVKFGDSVNYIGDNAFYKCHSLVTVLIPNGVTDICRYTFWECTGLTSIVISGSIDSIGKGAFQNCSSLTSVTYCGTEQQWNIINIGEYNTILTSARRYYHSWIDASCDSPKTCIYCQTTEGDKGHSWIDATCLMPQTCGLCGATKGTTVAHSGEWFEIVAPTCMENGVEARICEICKQTETSLLPAGHTYEIVVTAPTCTEQGYTTKTCTRCGEENVYDFVAPNGHFWSAWLTTKAATCIAKGSELRFCNCGMRETRSVVTLPHDALNSACGICNQITTGYCKLSQDILIDLSLIDDLYIDLNGYDFSGTIITNGYKIYGMDSTTNRYTCGNMGYFNCVDENGNAIVPESLYTTEDMMRYMTIETENGYTFHRFYLGITKTSLSTTVVGFGYKAEFYGDEMVQQQIASVGYNLWLTEDRVVSRTTAFKNVLTLRLQNFDVMNYGEIPVNACATITLMDGTVITGTIHSHTLRQMVEAVNAAYTSYNTTQLTALQTMIQKNPAMQAWQVENIYKKETV